jgi:hypothetical protein
MKQCTAVFDHTSASSHLGCHSFLQYESTTSQSSASTSLSSSPWVTLLVRIITTYGVLRLLDPFPQVHVVGAKAAWTRVSRRERHERLVARRIGFPAAQTGLVVLRTHVLAFNGLADAVNSRAWTAKQLRAFYCLPAPNGARTRRRVSPTTSRALHDLDSTYEKAETPMSYE